MLRIVSILSSILTGSLSGLAFDHYGFAVFIWFSLVPFLFVLAKAKTNKSIILYSLLAGSVYALCSVFWMVHVHPLALLGLILYLSIYWIVFGIFASHFIDCKYNGIVLAAFWVLLEYVRVKFGFFGWNLLAYSQAGHLPMLQTADLFGPWLLSFIAVLINVLLFDIARKESNRTLGLQSMIFILLVVSGFIYGNVVLRKKPYEVKNNLSVSLIQPNVSQKEKWSLYSQNMIFDRIRKLSTNTPEDSLLIFPEAVWPQVLDWSDKEFFTSFVEDIDRSLVLGAVEELDGLYYNSALYLDNNARVLSRYSKTKLVPFGEYVPLRKFVSFIDVINEIGDMTPGNTKQLLNVSGVKLGTLICFEDVFPELAIEFVNNGADILVNITNDAWFKGHPQAYQHTLIARFRATETKRSLIRVANTGITAVVSPYGEILEKIEDNKKDVFVKGVLTTDVAVYTGKTFYSKYPYIFPLLCLIIVCLSVSLKISGGFYGNKDSRRN